MGQVITKLPLFAFVAMLLGWWVTIGIGIIGIVLVLGAVVLGTLASIGTPPSAISKWFFCLCFLYFCYWAIAGWFYPPMTGYVDSLWRIAPVMIIGVLPMVIDHHVLVRRFNWLVWAGLAGVFVLCSIIAVESVGVSRIRTGGLHGNPLLAGSALLVGVLLPIAWWQQMSQLGKVITIIAFFLALFVAFFWVQARASSLLLFGLGSPILLAMMLRKFRGALRWFWRIIAILAIVAIVIGVSYYLIYVLEHHAALRMRDGIYQLSRGWTGGASAEPARDLSLSIRGLMWQEGTRVFAQAPLFGHGIQHRFDAVDVEIFKRFRPSFSHLHSSFLTHAVGGGIVGIGLWLGLILFPIWWIVGRALRVQKWRQKPLSLLLLAVAVSLLPLFSGLINVVMFEGTLVTLALMPIAFWVMHVGSLGTENETVSNLVPQNGNTMHYAAPQNQAQSTLNQLRICQKL